MKPDGMTDDYYAYMLGIGWTDDDIARIWHDLETHGNRQTARTEPRDITCTNYENAQKRLHKRVDYHWTRHLIFLPTRS